MNKEQKNFLSLFGLLFFLSWILFHQQEVKKAILFATELWLNNIFPSLFPMFILSDLLIYAHFPELLAKILSRPWQKIWKTNEYGIFILIMSLLSGTPSSAILIKKMLETNKITTENANHFIKFTFFENPLFLITMYTQLFPNAKIIWLLIITHYLANFILAFLLRPKAITTSIIQIQKEKENFGSVLTTSIASSMNILITILGTIAFYLTVSTCLNIQNPLFNTIIKGFLELTQGLYALKTLPVSLWFKVVFALIFTSFGGLSIHTQIRSIITGTPISYISFLKGRIYSIPIHLSLFFLLYASITLIP